MPMIRFDGAPGRYPTSDIQTPRHALLQWVRDYPFTTLIIAVAVGCLATLGVIEIARVAPGPTDEETSTSVSINAIDVIATFAGEEPDYVDVRSVRRLDLVGDKRVTEFIARYNVAAFDEDRVGVYSVRDGKPRLLVHPQRFGLEVSPVTFDGRDFLILHSLEGSGGFLTFRVMSWDGEGALEREFAAGCDESDPGLIFGHLSFVGDRVLVDGGGLKQELLFEDGRFALRALALHPTHDPAHPDRHVIRMLLKDDRLAFTLDGKPMGIKPAEGDRQHVVTPTVTLMRGESLLFDDNFEQHRGVRIITNGIPDRWETDPLGLFDVFVPHYTGDIEFMINDSYGPWYTLTVRVVAAASGP